MWEGDLTFRVDEIRKGTSITIKVEIPLIHTLLEYTLVQNIESKKRSQ